MVGKTGRKLGGELTEEMGRRNWDVAGGSIGDIQKSEGTKRRRRMPMEIPLGRFTKWQIWEPKPLDVEHAARVFGAGWWFDPQIRKGGINTSIPSKMGQMRIGKR
jgi:hypothetical protein